MAEINLDDLPRTRKEAKATGARHYFTGYPCKRGHISARSVSAASCSACESDRQRARHSENRDEILAAARARYASNPDDKRQKNLAWNAANKDHLSIYWQEYASSNLDKKAANSRNRRARKRDAEGTHTAEDIDCIRKAQKDKCGYCGVKLKGRGNVDHIVALSKGGSNAPRNLQLLCERCNKSKNARDPIEFAQSLGMII